MKMISLISIALTMTTSLGACGNGDQLIPANPPSENPEKPGDDDDNSAPGNGRSLAVYFSCTNTTKGIADKMNNEENITRRKALKRMGASATGAALGVSGLAAVDGLKW